MTTSPDLGIPYIASQQAQPEITHNEGLSLMQALLNGVISRGVNTPPGSPDEGDAYIVGESPTDDWSGRANRIAVFFGTAWLFLPGNDSNGDPIDMGARQVGLRIWVRDEGIFYVWQESGSPPAFGWSAGLPAAAASSSSYDNQASGLDATNVQEAIDELADITSSPTMLLGTACSDLTTDLGVALDVGVLFAPFNCEIIDIIAGLATPASGAPSPGAAFVVDINVNGSTILDNKVTFDDGEDTNLTAAVPYSFITAGSPPVEQNTLSAADKITIDIDQVGMGSPPTPGKGLQVILVVRETGA